MIPEVRGGKSFGTAGRGKGVSADVEVPIVETSKPVVTVVEPIRKNITMSQVIPEAAVEAAGQALRDAFDWGVTDFDKQARDALEAAAPHMRQAFFLEMNLRAVQDELANHIYPRTSDDQ